jgi:transposase-like protein
MRDLGLAAMGPDMEAAAFANWLAGIRFLDLTQRSRASRELALPGANDPLEMSDHAIDAVAPPGEAEAAPGNGLLSKVGQGRIASFGCPHCGRDDIRPWGNAGGKPRYRCAICRRTFNPLTGTPLAGLRYKDRWNDQVQALISGEPLARAAERCNVAYTTAFRWRHKFLSALNLDKPKCLDGIVEAEKTSILESFESNRSAKGRRSNIPKASRTPSAKASKRGGKASKRDLSAD